MKNKSQSPNIFLQNNNSSNTLKSFFAKSNKGLKSIDLLQYKSFFHERNPRVEETFKKFIKRTRDLNTYTQKNPESPRNKSFRVHSFKNLNDERHNTNRNKIINIISNNEYLRNKILNYNPNNPEDRELFKGMNDGIFLLQQILNLDRTLTKIPLTSIKLHLNHQPMFNVDHVHNTLLNRIETEFKIKEEEKKPEQCITKKIFKRSFFNSNQRTIGEKDYVYEPKRLNNLINKSPCDFREEFISKTLNYEIELNKKITDSIKILLDNYQRIMESRQKFRAALRNIIYVKEILNDYSYKKSTECLFGLTKTFEFDSNVKNTLNNQTSRQSLNSQFDPTTFRIKFINRDKFIIKASKNPNLKIISDCNIKKLEKVNQISRNEPLNDNNNSNFNWTLNQEDLSTVYKRLFGENKFITRQTFSLIKEKPTIANLKHFKDINN